MANEQGDESPKIHIDSDWKAEAQREKEKMAAKSQQQADADQTGEAGEGGEQQMPPANFETLVSTMATQALFAMGAIPDPRTGERMAHLDLAKHHIDMLGVLEETTKGNLSEEDSQLITQTVSELRNHYVQIQAQAQQQPGQGGMAQPGANPLAGGDTGPIQHPNA